MEQPHSPPAITILPELQAYIDPLTADEHEALERSLLAEGCRDALVLWGDVLVDGHNRYGICQQHGLPFNTVQNHQFQSLEDVHLWMIDQHLGRRSVSQFQRGVLALRKREIIAARRAAAAAAVNAAKAEEAQATQASAPWEPASDDQPAPGVARALAAMPKVPEQALDTREALARAARLTPAQVKMIEAIHQNAAPEVVSAVKTGELSLNAAAVVASLPLQEQQTAAQGGAEELKQAAKRVRQAKKKPKPTDTGSPQDEAGQPAPDATALQARIHELEAENQRLREQVKALQELLAEQGG
ncbi:hypothetical protein MASR1M59_23260 [Melaminivora sp.]